MDKIIVLSPKDAKHLTKVLNSPTAQKILDYLDNKEATQSQIVKDLKLAASTVNHTIKILQKAGMVTVEEFHYSQKGKEVNHYKLTNKYVVITPRASSRSLALAELVKLIPAVLMPLLAIPIFTQEKPVQALHESARAAPVADVAFVQTTTVVQEPNIMLIVASIVGFALLGYLIGLCIWHTIKNKI